MAQSVSKARFKEAASLVLNAIEEDKDSYLCAESTYISNRMNSPYGNGGEDNKNPSDAVAGNAGSTNSMSLPIKPPQLDSTGNMAEKSADSNCPECGQANVHTNRRSDSRRKLDKPSMSAPPSLSLNDNFLKVEDTDRLPTKPMLKSRKISLSCLVSSVLNFERGRRRASRAREEELLQAAEAGDFFKVKKLMQPDGVVNINCTDPLGRTPLHLAVANEHKEVVNFLLSHVDKKSVYQALMLAINLGHDEIAEMVIENPTYEKISHEIREQGQAHFFLSTFGDDNQFSEEITPLILAAQQNRFEIVMALLMKGELIQKPHKYQCACVNCDRMAKTDELKFAKARLNAYKGLASEAYISLSSEDPILTSFDLRKELRQVAADEKYYTAEYSSLADQLSDYVVRLLDKVHGNEELNAILNACDEESPDDLDNTTLARLQLAIENKEKKFVAHPSCQKKLTSMWYADFNTLLKSRSWAYSIAFVTGIVTLYPALAICYIVWPKTRFGNVLRTPVVKFVAQAVSFMLFLGLILAHSYVEQTKLCSTKLTDDRQIEQNWVTFHGNLTGPGTLFLAKMCVRNHSPSLFELLIILWITGLLWQECKQVYQSGFKAHFTDIYNHMDFFMLEFYIASITLRQMQHYMVYSAFDYFRHKESWLKLVARSDEAMFKLYLLNADRYYWDDWDPYSMCEAFFAVGNVLNFTRLFYLLAISEHLGPMLISLERMIKDVMKFMVTFVPICMSFMVGLYNMYWYYNPNVRGKVEATDHNIHTRAEEGFGNLEMTFRTMYWALYGLKDSRLVELKDTKMEGLGFPAKLTERVGYIVFGVYNWGSVIILLNMLIAMMTRSFEKITIHQDIEWKFARSKLYMEYIEEGSTLPVPFNLVPSVKQIMNSVKKCLNCCCLQASWERRGTKEKLLMRASLNSNTNVYNNKSSSFGPEENNREAKCETTYIISDAQDNNVDGGCHNRASVPPQTPSLSSSPVFMPRSFGWGQNPPRTGENDYKTVIKRVVRRYIFEHLQATVGGECANEQQSAEAMKQEFHTIHTEINSLKPKVQSEFERTRAEMVEYRMEMKEMKKSIGDMHKQLELLTSVCKSALVSNTTSSGTNCSSCGLLKTSNNDCGELLLNGEDIQYKLPTRSLLHRSADNVQQQSSGDCNLHKRTLSGYYARNNEGVDDGPSDSMLPGVLASRNTHNCFQTSSLRVAPHEKTGVFITSDRSSDRCDSDTGVKAQEICNMSMSTVPKSGLSPSRSKPFAMSINEPWKPLDMFPQSSADNPWSTNEQTHSAKETLPQQVPKELYKGYVSEEVDLYEYSL